MWQTQTDRVTGRGHQRQGMPCQDRVLSMERNGVTAIALADGAGSAALSHEGAECAVQAVCELLCENFDALFSAQSSAEVRHFLLSGVRDRIRDRKSGKLLVASAPQNGEFANTTTFVTSPDALMHSRALRGVQPRIEGFFLMSDGCEAALYHKGKRKLAPLISKPFLRLQLLSSGTSQEMLEAVMERIIAKRTQDDCSMALLVKNAGRSGMWSRMTP